MPDEHCDCPACGNDSGDTGTPDALRALPESLYVERGEGEFTLIEERANTVRRLLNMRALMLTLIDQMQGTPAYHAALRENSFALYDFGIPSDVHVLVTDRMLGKDGDRPWESGGY